MESRKDREDVVDRHLSASFETTNPNLSFFFGCHCFCWDNAKASWLVTFSDNKTELRAGWKYHEGWWWVQFLDLEGLFWSAAGFSHSSCSCGSGESSNRTTCTECTGLFQVSPEWVQRGGRSLATCIRLGRENRWISYHCTQCILQWGFKSSCCKVCLALQKCTYMLKWKRLD